MSRGHIGEQGASLIEALMVMSLMVILAGVATPLASATIDAGRARQAAAFMASYLRFAKQQAAFRTAYVGLVFDQVDGRWTFRVCVDQNANGLRRAELLRGRDRCVEGPLDVQASFPGVQIAVDSTIRGPDGEPGSADAVRFGRSDMASFSPDGTGTSGTLFLRSTKGVQYAVRVAGFTGRTRVLQYDAVALIWKEV